MKYLFWIAILVLFSFSCKKDNVDPVNKTPEEMLSDNGWALVRFTDTSGKTIPNSSLNSSALFLTQMIFEFRTNKETRAVDKISKNIINRGTWALMDNDATLDINIVGFKGQFKIIKIESGALILQATNDNFLSGVGATINMEFEKSAI